MASVKRFNTFGLRHNKSELIWDRIITLLAAISRLDIFKKYIIHRKAMRRKTARFMNLFVSVSKSFKLVIEVQAIMQKLPQSFRLLKMLTNRLCMILNNHNQHNKLKKNARGRLKICLRLCANFTFGASEWYNERKRGRHKPSPIIRFKLAFWIRRIRIV